MIGLNATARYLMKEKMMDVDQARVDAGEQPDQHKRAAEGGLKMEGMIPVGVMAMRNPINGDFMESVTLYVEAKDQKKVEAPVFDDDAIRMLADKWKEYVQLSNRAKKGKKGGA